MRETEVSARRVEPPGLIGSSNHVLGVNPGKDFGNPILYPCLGDKAEVALGGHGKPGRHPYAGLDHLPQASVLAANQRQRALIYLFQVENIVHLKTHFSESRSQLPLDYGSIGVLG